MNTNDKEKDDKKKPTDPQPADKPTNPPDKP